jgi:hypothetical protein
MHSRQRVGRSALLELFPTRVLRTSLRHCTVTARAFPETQLQQGVTSPEDRVILAIFTHPRANRRSALRDGAFEQGNSAG